MNRYQRGYVQGIGKAMMFVFAVVAVAGIVGGVLLWEGGQWLFSHLTIGWK